MTATCRVNQAATLGHTGVVPGHSQGRGAETELKPMKRAQKRQLSRENEMEKEEQEKIPSLNVFPVEGTSVSG